MCSQHCGAREGPASGEKGLIQPLQRAPAWKPPIRTSFPPMASNIFSSWTRSCWMLFIRMQGWSGGMERGVSTNKCGWNSCPLPQFPPTLHWGTQEQPWYRAPAWQHFGDCHQTETESRTCIMGTSSGGDGWGHCVWTVLPGSTRQVPSRREIRHHFLLLLGAVRGEILGDDLSILE